MEIICIDKRTFDELVVRFSMIEKKVTGICNPAKDAGLEKMDGQSGGMRDSPHIKENASGIS